MSIHPDPFSPFWQTGEGAAEKIEPTPPRGETEKPGERPNGEVSPRHSDLLPAPAGMPFPLRKDHGPDNAAAWETLNGVMGFTAQLSKPRDPRAGFIPIPPNPEAVIGAKMDDSECLRTGHANNEPCTLPPMLQGLPLEKMRALQKERKELDYIEFRDCLQSQLRRAKTETNPECGRNSSELLVPYSLGKRQGAESSKTPPICLGIDPSRAGERDQSAGIRFHRYRPMVRITAADIASAPEIEAANAEPGGRLRALLAGLLLLMGLKPGPK